MFESIFTDELISMNLSARNLLFAIAAALVIGVMISVTYMKTHAVKSPSQGFSVALVILPAVVTIIILLIGNSVARAFSLAGAFQIIRFRSAPGDPKDITFVLFSMAAGLCVGMGYLVYGVIAAVILCAVMFLLDIVKYGRVKSEREILRIVVPETPDYKNAFDDILTGYTSEYKRIGVKLTDLGSLFELRYAISPKPNADEKAFMDELRCRNGNLNISLTLDAQTSEF